MLHADTRPRITSRARLRYDAHSEKWLLLYPERGLELSETASDILRLCDGARTIRAIMTELAERYGDSPSGEVEQDALEFLNGLCDRGLVEAAP